jgi:hypothetical protein
VEQLNFEETRKRMLKKQIDKSHPWRSCINTCLVAVVSIGTFMFCFGYGYYWPGDELQLANRQMDAFAKIHKYSRIQKNCDMDLGK